MSLYNLLSFTKREKNEKIMQIATYMCQKTQKISKNTNIKNTKIYKIVMKNTNNRIRTLGFGNNAFLKKNIKCKEQTIKQRPFQKGL